MIWIRAILILLTLLTNIWFVWTYQSTKGEYRPPFNIYPNMIVAPSPFGGQLHPEIISSYITLPDGTKFASYDEALAWFNQAGSVRGKVDLAFTKTGDGEVEKTIIKDIPLVRLDAKEFLYRNWVLFVVINVLWLFIVYFYANSLDLYLTAFLLSILLFVAGFVALTTIGSGVVLYYLGIAALPYTMVNLARSLAGRNMPLVIFGAEAVLVVALVFIGAGNYFDQTAYLLLLQFNLSLMAAALAGTIIYFLMKAFTAEGERNKFLSMVLVFIVGVGLPIAGFSFFKDYDYGVSWMAFYLSLLLFPTGIVFIGYKYQLLPLKRLFGTSIVYTFVLSVLSLLYAVVIYVYNLILPEPVAYRDILPHVIFVIILVFFLDPLVSYTSRFFKREIFKLESELAAKLEQLALLVSNPGQIERSLMVLFDQIQTALGVEKITLLLPPELFPKLKTQAIMRASRHNPIWGVIARRKKFLLTRHLRTAAFQDREVYDFLMQENVELVFPMRSDQRTGRGCLLISPKPSGATFRLEEISFLSHAADMSNLLFENYILQMADIEKRKKERELDLSYEVQLELLPPRLEGLDPFEMDFFSIPARGVTGDYLDFFKVGDDELVLLMGDVTGHGLGPAYLMATSRSLIRSFMQNGYPLAECFQKVNEFLMNRYVGFEFMSLFAARLNLKTGVMRYVNAGHPPPVLHKKKIGRMVRLKKSDRILGVAPTEYRTSTMKFEPGDLFYAFSDGIFELFNPDGKTYGWERLNALLRTTDKKDLDTLTSKIVRSLKRFKRGEPWSDDVSFLVLRRNT